MNFIALKQHLESMVLSMNNDLTEDEKMEYFNTEVSNYLTSLMDSGVLYDFTFLCETSNQRSDNMVHADIALKYPAQENFYYVHLQK